LGHDVDSVPCCVLDDSGPERSDITGRRAVDQHYGRTPFQRVADTDWASGQPETNKASEVYGRRDTTAVDHRCTEQLDRQNHQPDLGWLVAIASTSIFFRKPSFQFALYRVFP